MTPWCVVDEQRTKKQRVPAWGRLVLVSVVALLVVGTGMVLIPRDSGTPPARPFSENARLAALEDTLLLRDTAAALADASGLDAAKPAAADAVTLLTTHARALLDPTGLLPTSPAAASPTNPVSSASSAKASLFVTELSRSGQQRLDDARGSDGGMAHLLAAVGSAQLLSAEKLAAEWKLPEPSRPSTGRVPVSPPAAGSCPSAGPTPDPDSATTDTALTSLVRAQHEAVYVYQVAVKRLGASSVSAAARDLEVHEVVLRQAEDLTRVNCGDVPAGEAGYRLPAKFAKDPAAALADLESSSLPRFGDLVALSADGTRDWAIDGLLAASRRSAAWGAGLPALPGLELDAGDLPSLPTPSDASSPTSSSR